MAGPGNILITVGADTVAAVRNLGNVSDALGDTMTRSEKMSAGLKKAALPAAAALGAIGFAAIGAAKAAMADAASADHLAQTLKRVTGAGQPAIKGMEDWITKTSLASGVADDELRPAIEKLATATGSVTKAQKLANVALDIAAATGKDVDTVSTALAKGYQGQTGAIVKLVPGISKAARESKDYATIMEEVTKKTEGASKAYSETAQGSMKRMSVATGELQESLGQALLPAIESIIPVLLKMAEFAQDNVGVIKILVGVVATLAAGILAANVALKAYEAAQVLIKAATTAWTAVQWLLNAALNANPIGLVVVALTALTAGIVLAYQKSDTFKDVVQAAMAAVKIAIDKVVDVFTDLFNAAKKAFDWIVEHWQIAKFAFGPIAVAVTEIVNHWNDIKEAVENVVTAFGSALTAAKAAFDWIVDHWKLAAFAFGPIGAAVYLIATNWDKLKAAADAAGDVVGRVLSAMSTAFATAADKMSAAASKILGWLTDIWNKADSVISKIGDVLHWIDKVPRKLPGIPGIPDIWPFSTGSAAAASSRTLTPAATAAGPQIVINVSGALDPEGVARQIERLLLRHQRRQGSIA